MSSVYDNYLKEHNFSLRLEQWAKQYKNKKVILYGCGLLFDKIVELYDIKNKLNIVAVCDVKYEKNKPDTYLGFKTIKPSDLSKTDYDVLIFTVFDHLTCLNYLNTFDFFHENKEFRYINEMALKGKFISFILKAKTAAKYLAFTKNPFKTAKYFFSCNNIEFNSKLNYQKVLKRLRKKKDKIKVIFIVESNQKWGWQSVYDELKKDSRFELLLVTLPLTTRFKDKIYPQKEDIEFFSQRNMPIIDGYDYKNEICIDLKELGADIIFYTHPWFVDVHKIPPSITSEFALTCAVSYGFNLVESKCWGTTTPRNFCSNLWTMFAESKWHKPFYENGTNLKNKDILFVTGYPKMDAYNLPVNPEFEKIWKDENHTKPRIIYAPHHSIERDGGFGMSNFVEQAQFFLDFAKNHPQYEFLIKPHPVLKSKCEATGFMTGEEYENYIEQWRELPNWNAYTLGNYYDVFKTSDILITDSSSFLGEYFVSGKPIVLLESKSRMPFNDFGLELRKGMYKPQEVEEIENILEEIFEHGNDSLKETRDRIIKKQFVLPEGGVAKRITDYIKKQLLL